MESQSNMERHQNLLNKIIDETVTVIDKNKDQIFGIYISACEELQAQKEQLANVIKQINITADEVDSMEITVQRGRQELLAKSKGYTEADIKNAHDYVATLIDELQELREKEQGLWTLRNDLERRLKKVEDMRDNAEKLTVAIGSMANYLTEQLSGIATQYEDDQEKMEVGVAMIRAYENERLRVSRELHDGVAQEVASIMWQLNFCKITAGKESASKTTEALDEAIKMAKDCQVNVRHAIFDMRPMSLDDHGLPEAVHELCDILKTRGVLSPQYSIEGNKFQIPKWKETAAYRIIQEAINNVIHHSGQEKVKVRFVFGSESVNITIEDKGRGFDITEDPNKDSSRKHFGLMGMQERAKYIGAQLQTISSPGKGTKVRLVIPRE